MNHSNFLTAEGIRAIEENHKKNTRKDSELKADDRNGDRDPMAPGLGVIGGAVLGLLLWVLVAVLWL